MPLADRRPQLPPIIIPGTPSLYSPSLTSQDDNLSPSWSASPRSFDLTDLASSQRRHATSVLESMNVKKSPPENDFYQVLDPRWTIHDLEAGTKKMKGDSRWAHCCPSPIVLICGIAMVVVVSILVASVVISIVSTK